MPSGIYLRTKKHKRINFQNGCKTQFQKGHKINLGKRNALGIHWEKKNVSYFALHQRLYRKKGKPKKCEICNTTKAKKYEWANLTNAWQLNVKNFGKKIMGLLFVGNAIN